MLTVNVWKSLEEIIQKYDRQNISVLTGELSAKIKF